ncbi:MAG: metallophosphoesterase [Clostridia bacterium]|nr:metallophosphoesterase [Clostridia bacterium]
MKKTLFVTTDIHGHATELKEALKEAGFRRDNPDHLLVVCGDYFDRGTENRAVYTYLDGLKNKILIRGNHDHSLENVLLNGKLTITDHMNGMERTIKEFFRGDYIPEFNFIYTDETTDGYKDLNGFLGEMRDYFETENYVFTHGWLPMDVNIGTLEANIRPDWRYETPKAWKDASWTEWQKVYPYRPLLEGKTIVVGHRSTEYGSMFDPNREKKCSLPFYGEGMIALDALTVVSKRVNVIVIEDEFPDPVTHEMKLLDHPFEEIKAGRKKVEMRLFDEKRQKLRAGDRITFTNEKTGEKLTVTVVGLHRFDNFVSLANAFTPKELGFKDETANEIAKIMNGIYSYDDVANHGVLAIRVSRNAYSS